MERYTIYCTPEQTQKALELGAPIEKKEIQLCDNAKNFFWYDGFYYNYPTAEQMIGWLEEQGISIVSRRLFTKWGFMLEQLHEAGELNPHIGSKNIYLSRKEATLAAIDAALEYLSKSKK